VGVRDRIQEAEFTLAVATAHNGDSSERAFEAQLRLGDVLIEGGLLARAVEEYQSAVIRGHQVLGPNDPRVRRARLGLAAAHAAAGDLVVPWQTLYAIQQELLSGPEAPTGELEAVEAAIDVADRLCRSEAVTEDLSCLIGALYERQTQ